MTDDDGAGEDLFAVAWLRPPEHAIGFVLWRVLHRYVREVNRALGELRLTHLQFQTLALAAWLGRSGQPATQSDIARAGDVQKMQISQMMQSLEQRGLVTRVRSNDDERAKRVTVTAVGLTTLQRALPLVAEVQRTLFGDGGMPGGGLLKALRAVETGGS